MRRLIFILLGFLAVLPAAVPQGRPAWRAATYAELESALPARAPVQRERIETEMRTASGIINERGQVVAAVVLITAGYSADGKYSHFFLTQVPITIGDDLKLAAGQYVVGWKRDEKGLVVRFFDASTGVERGALLARPANQLGRIESFRIWPPSERPIIQIGRFTLSYLLGS